MDQNPAIIVIGYNRPESLKRLLDSISRADYESENITLVISLDKSDNKIVASDVRKVSDDFCWARGDKRVIVKEKNIGLKAHVLACGDLSHVYGSIIVLEDDLLVSRSFYLFATQALEYFKNDSRISGISLYTYHRNRCEGEPFYPLIDGKDNFFLQMTSSWGQIWTNEQWKGFREWFNNNMRVMEEDPLPRQVIKWPESSWAKYYNKYLVVKNKTFVYPRDSLTTNFSEKGVHYAKRTNIEQVPVIANKREYTFGVIEESFAVYDAFFEILPGILQEKFGVFKEYDFEVDLYGQKDKNKLRKDYVLTSRSKCSGIKSFASDMVPLELNIVFDINGDTFSLIKLEDMVDKEEELQVNSLDAYQQFSNTYTLKSAVIFTIRKILEKITLISGKG